MHNNLIPADLAEVIATHRDIFGGFTMQADPVEQQQDTDAPPADKDKSAEDDKDFKSPESKAAVLADLRKERDKRQALEARVEKLAPLEKLAAALLPDEPTGGEDATAAAIKAIEDRIAAAEHRALVAEASEGLTDEDKAILSKITDPELLASVAERLKRDASTDQQSGKSRRLPKPDPSAGRGGSDEKSLSSVAEGRDLYRSRHKSN